MADGNNILGGFKIMALIKNKMTDLGVEAGYWKVTMISVDRYMKTGSFSLALFINKGAKQFINLYCPNARN